MPVAAAAARASRCRHAATAPGAGSRWASGVGGAGIESGTAEPRSNEGSRRLSACQRPLLMRLTVQVAGLTAGSAGAGVLRAEVLELLRVGAGGGGRVVRRRVLLGRGAGATAVGAAGPGRARRAGAR